MLVLAWVKLAAGGDMQSPKLLLRGYLWDDSDVANLSRMLVELPCCR